MADDPRLALGALLDSFAVQTEHRDVTKVEAFRELLVALLEDIVDGRTVTLGAGWHVREGTGADGYYRWARSRAFVQIDRSDDPLLSADAALDIEVEPNPYDPGSPLELEIADETGAVVTRVVVAHRRTVRLTVPGGMPSTEAVSATVRLRKNSSPITARCALLNARIASAICQLCSTRSKSSSARGMSWVGIGTSMTRAPCRRYPETIRFRVTVYSHGPA